jgi:hypothetical protein
MFDLRVPRLYAFDVFTCITPAALRASEQRLINSARHIATSARLVVEVRDDAIQHHAC